MDRIDLKILDFLQTDARITAKELASRLSLSATPIYERIRKLERQGIIKQYVAILNPDMLGRSLMVFLNMTIREHQKDARAKLLKQLTEMDEITELYHTSGTYDFVAKVRFASVKEYRDFLVDRVANLENIADIESHIVLDEIKHSTRINL